MVVGGAIAALVAWRGAWAQGSSTATSPPAAISVTGRGEVQVNPDRVRIQLGVETQAKTSALATQENNRKQGAVLRALRALGIAESQLQTLEFTVAPVDRYDQATRRSVIDGYRVSNIVQVESDKLDQSGSVLDAALAAGANRVVGIEFYVKEREKAEDEALKKAVESARRQASVAAAAAGGRADELMELTIGAENQPMPYPAPMVMTRMAVADAAAPTPVASGVRTIVVTVSSRWRFVRP